MIPSRHYQDAVVIAPRCEDDYFALYRQEHPEESFRHYTYEEVVALFEFDVDESKVPQNYASLLPYLKKMVGRGYKSLALEKYLPLVNDFIRDGVFHKKEDPADIFCGKSIIIRGYYSGKMIAEALQGLPNISLNWDLGRARLGLEEAPKLEALSLTEALEAIAEDERIRYVRYDGEDLAFPRPGLKQIRGPYLPSLGPVAYIERPVDSTVGEDPFDDAALAELHLVNQSEKKRRRLADEENFLRGESLLLRFLLP